MASPLKHPSNTGDHWPVAAVMALAMQLAFPLAANAADPATGLAETWSNVSATFTRQLGADDANPSFLSDCQGLIVTPTGDLVMQTAKQGICMSKDQGATWSVVEDNDINGRTTDTFSSSLAYPYDGRMAFFAYDGADGTSGGISRDGGKTWTAFSQLKRGVEFGDVDWNAKAPQTLYGITHEPYFTVLSGDGGKTWKRLDDDETGAEPLYDVGVIDGANLVRYNKRHDDIEASADAGLTWNLVANFHVQGRHPVHYGRTLYWTTTQGVIRSPDGKSWTLTGAGAENAQQGPFFGASDQDFVVVTDQDFLKTEDGGASWKPLAKTFIAPEVFGHSLRNCYFGWDPAHAMLFASGLGAPVYRLKL